MIMTREIKFRGRDASGTWFFGDLHQWSNGEVYIGVDGGVWTDDGMNSQSYPSFNEIDPDTVGQFTGLHDKNGKEIYEGDIVHLDTWKPDAMQIKFIEAAFCLADANGSFLGDIHYVHHGSIEQCTVLGNIYDNPKLLN